MVRSAGLDAITKVATRTRLSETTAAIRRLVLDGVVPTGARLREQELADALGVSRPTVREAVRQLVHEGILVHEPYKGLRVATVDDEQYSQLSEVRAALEVIGAQRVGARLTPELDAQLADAVDRIRTARDLGAFNDAHFAFHALTARLSGSDILEQAWDLVENRSRMVLRVDQEIDPEADRVTPHVRVLEAIRTRDPGAIDTAVRDHIIGSALTRMALRKARGAPTLDAALSAPAAGRGARTPMRRSRNA